MGKKYAITDTAGIYFITFATVGWVDVFSRKIYRDMLVDNLLFCQRKKGLVLYSWCIMTNHIHLVASPEQHDLSNIIRSFKSYTAKLVVNAVYDIAESRREWMLDIFKKARAKNPNNAAIQFWQQDNQFTEVYSKAFAFQKFHYIHNNPVEAGWVEKAEEYV